MSETVYIGLGSNLGEREENLLAAHRALGRIDAAQVARRSSIFESVAVGPPQPPYLNAVVELECALEPRPLLAILKEIERELGRPPGSGTRWGPRTIDLDILLWDRRVVADPDLQVPHLEMHKRRFVLEPLAELAPEATHPLTGKRVAEMLRAVQSLSGRAEQRVMRFDSSHWPNRQLLD